MSKWIVALDAEHGGEYPGAVYGGYKEKDLNLQMAYLTAGAILQYADDVSPYLIREDDRHIPFQSRADKAKTLNADLYIQISHNAGGGEGLEIFRYTKAYAITEKIQRDIYSVLSLFYTLRGMKLRGCKTGDYKILRITRMPALIVELGFLSNERDRQILTRNDLQYELASYLARGIVYARQVNN